jgi:hypothetical protein
MEISWQAWARLYAPYLFMAGCSIVGAIYGLGYRNGIAAVLTASKDDATQPRRTVPSCAL